MLSSGIDFAIIAGVAILFIVVCRRLGGRLDKTSYADLVPDGGVHRIVTLVHGTWPRGFLNLGEVEWYRSTSALCSALRSRGQDHILIHRFRWSGANSIAARLDAADTLKSELSAQFNKYPGAVDSIVAHSHGGNVVLSALRDASIAGRISGIVCLSTPFLRVSVRPWVKPQLALERQWLLQMFQALAGFAVLAVVIIVRMQLGSTSLPTWIPLTIRPVVTALGYVLMVLVGLMALSLISLPTPQSLSIGRLWRGLYKRAVSYAAELGGTCPDQVRLLIVRPVADEASAALAVGQFLAWTVGYIDALSVRLVTLVGIGAMVVWMVMLVPRWRPQFTASDLLLWLMGVVLGAALTSQVVRAITALPFGLPLSRFTPLLDISAEASPTGRWTILQLPPGEARGSFHSSTHEEPHVAAAVTDWLFNPV